MKELKRLVGGILWMNERTGQNADVCKCGGIDYYDEKGSAARNA